MLETKTLKISQLKFNTGQIQGVPKNPRFIKDERYVALIKSIRDEPEMLKIRELVVYPVDDHFVVICGNMRLRALKELKFEETFCKILDQETSPEKLRAYTIKDNISFGTDDWETLEKEWNREELENWGVETPEQWKETELKELEGQEDIPELKANPFVVYGDIFEIKFENCKYRIGCLNSTSTTDLEKLFDGNKIDLVFTDPPYGVNITKTQKNSKSALGKLPEIAGDKDTSIAKEFWQTCQSLGIQNYIIWGGNYFTDFLPPSRCWIIWDKKVGKGMTFARGEMAWTTGRKKKSKKDGELAWTNFDRNLDIYEFLWSGSLAGKVDTRIEGILETVKPQSRKTERVHPTQKPVQLQIDILKDYDQNWTNIFDGFSGGGTTLLTGIQTKKNVFASEITEYYAQVSVKRCVDFLTKNNINFEITLNNQPFDTLKLK